MTKISEDSKSVVCAGPAPRSRWSRGGLLSAILILCLSFGAASKEPAPDAGLLWQRTGLPLVFPLVVKTRIGNDYYMTLHDPGSGEAMLAAYLRGGTFFKILVPPGTYKVRFAKGATWQGESDLFGAGTTYFFLSDDLTFEVRGRATKTGHVIDLTRSDGIPIIEARLVCQRYATEAFPRPLPPFDGEGFETRITDPGRIMRHPDAFFDPLRSESFDRPVIPTDHAPYFGDATPVLKDFPC